MIRAIRAIPKASSLGGKPGVEIEVTAASGFPAMGEMPVLRVGAREFALSRYPEDGNTQTLIFTLTTDEFASVHEGDPVVVRYGDNPEFVRFGPITKALQSK
ncbi:MAG: hypothetical protein NVS3B20_25150 [Polyangiales bacterium]